MRKSSRIPGFYKLDLAERLRRVQEMTDLTPEEVSQLTNVLTPDRADKMVENAVGVYGLPLGIAVNFLINERDYLVPMAIEEPSVIAGASYAARLFRDGGGFTATTSAPVMISQVQIVDVPTPHAARVAIFAEKERIINTANQVDSTLVSLGGGAQDLEVRALEHTPIGTMLIVHLLVDVRDAMGANAVNTMAETVAPMLEEITGGRVYLRILSNLADRRVVRVRGTIPKSSLETADFTGAEVVRGIIAAYAFAAADPYRAATHNKGIMNGIDAVVIATGNDWRAVEAGAHAYAARHNQYTTLSHWEQDAAGDLVGSLEMPLAVGIVGGATRVHPTAQLALKIMNISDARELAQVIGAVGLAQNLAALRALATEGIQRGHMSLHARNVAIEAGAFGKELDRVVAQMVKERNIRVARAKEILAEQKT